ncbi:T-cell immunomodulatory protein-like [Diadema antillarum]|uniref:T-cell immunomodulatory protein-like n=1 Tax=Diadema antillarum TaxID=105358 RepID=UPI003A8A120D
MAVKPVGYFFIVWMAHLFTVQIFTGFSHAVLVDMTDSLGGPLDGLIATFGDFNMDKKTDVVIISDNGHRAELYLKDGNDTHILHPSPTAYIERPNDVITSIGSGDFDGDFQLDLLITTKPTSDPFNTTSPTRVYVYWGDISDMQFVNETLVTDQLRDQPLIMDSNADTISDIFGEEVNGQKKFWLTRANSSRHFVSHVLRGREDYHLKIPNSNAFLDLTGDLAANLFLTTLKPGTSDVVFEVWTYTEGVDGEPSSWHFTEDYEPPSGGRIEHMGISTFADMDADGLMDHILPVCYNAACINGSVFVRFQRLTSWQQMFDGSTLSGDRAWGFVPPTVHLTDFASLPLMLRAGDLDLDTYFDLLVVMQSTNRDSSVQRRLALLRNNAGNDLIPQWITDPSTDNSSPILASFLDIQRTGELDVMLVNQTESGENRVCLLANKMSIDAYFVQVEVLRGLCDSTCPGNASVPYGINQPGPAVRYDTTSSTGNTQKSGGSQLSQSAYFSLQLPYVLLGLGQNPNFVDYLRVGVPAAVSDSGRNSRVHEWTSIIPNSQLIVIPSPLDQPDDWISKILIVPGQSVLLTGVVLICTCAVLALTAAGLHYKERKDDEKEKRQEAHRFHFDAM